MTRPRHEAVERERGRTTLGSPRIDFVLGRTPVIAAFFYECQSARLDTEGGDRLGPVDFSMFDVARLFVVTCYRRPMDGKCVPPRCKLHYMSYSYALVINVGTANIYVTR